MPKINSKWGCENPSSIGTTLYTKIFPEKIIYFSIEEKLKLVTEIDFKLKYCILVHK